MNKRLSLNWFPLVGTLVVGVLHILLQQISGEIELLRLPTAVLLILVLPGYTASLALFPHPAGGWPERWLLSLGLSIIIVILGSMSVYWFERTLSDTSWMLLCIGVALLFSLVAVVRSPKEVSVSAIQLSRGQLVIAGAGGLVVVTALLVAIWGEQIYQTKFTQLWAMPTANQQTILSVGVGNYEGQTMTYTMDVRQGSELLYQQADITLVADEVQVFVIPLDLISQIRPLSVVLYREDDQDTVYRRVHIWPE